MNTSPCFTILRAAPLTQLQDLGRFGWRHLGFSTGGAMDSLAFVLNNRLLENPENAAQLEIAPGGLSLRAERDCTIAIAGAYQLPKLNGKPLVNFHTVQIKAGDRLDFGYARNGQYAYLAVAGGFVAKPFLNSLSTIRRLNIAPNHGEMLTDGSQLFVGENPIRTTVQGVKRTNIPDYQQQVLDILPAYQFSEFTPAMRAIFCQQRYQILASDRMGTRLQGGEQILWTHGDILSEGIVSGAVQITHEGQPIVLQKDAQTIGGYPKIGVLTDSSRSLLSQMPTGRKVKFQFIENTWYEYC